MTTGPKECLRCRGPMEVGVTMDRSHNGVPLAQEWLSGEPVRSFWMGLKTKGRTVCAVRTYRCSRCGYLESYGQPKAAR